MKITHPALLELARVYAHAAVDALFTDEAATVPREHAIKTRPKKKNAAGRKGAKK